MRSRCCPGQELLDFVLGDERLGEISRSDRRRKGRECGQAKGRKSPANHVRNVARERQLPLFGLRSVRGVGWDVVIWDPPRCNGGLQVGVVGDHRRDVGG